VVFAENIADGDVIRSSLAVKVHRPIKTVWSYRARFSCKILSV